MQLLGCWVGGGCAPAFAASWYAPAVKCVDMYTYIRIHNIPAAHTQHLQQQHQPHPTQPTNVLLMNIHAAALARIRVQHLIEWELLAVHTRTARRQ